MHLWASSRANWRADICMCQLWHAGRVLSQGPAGQHTPRRRCAFALPSVGVGHDVLDRVKGGVADRPRQAWTGRARRPTR